MSTKRRRLAWLRPPHAEPGGVMSLADHLRELRYRLLVSSVVIVIAACLAAIWFNQLYLLLMQPYLQAVDILKQAAPNLNPTTVISGVTAPFVLVLQVSLIAGLVASSPIWLYQLWAFIAPALMSKEKRYALAFLAAAIPLFLLGVVIG